MLGTNTVIALFGRKDRDGWNLSSSPLLLRIAFESVTMSRFVSGGTVDKPTERDNEWLKAQEQIEAARRKKEDEGRQEGGKSLYEVLQANKGVFAHCGRG